MRAVFRWVSVGIGFAPTIGGCASTERDPRAVAHSDHADSGDAAAPIPAGGSSIAVDSDNATDSGNAADKADAGRYTTDAGSSGGSGSVESDAGDAGGKPVGAAGEPNVPSVDPEVSVEYSWTECGRIAGTGARPMQALYAVDGSVLVLGEDGSVLLHDAVSVAPRTLVQPLQEPTDVARMALSRDGRYLAVRQEADLDVVYTSSDGAPIGAGTELLEASTLIDHSESPCHGGVEFSSNAELLVNRSGQSACLWDAASGQMRSFVELPDGRVLAGVAVGADPLRVLHEGTSYNYTLHTYTLEGELVSSFDLSMLPGEARVSSAVFSPDATTLLALIRPAATATPLDLVAIETSTGVERWRQTLSGDALPQLTLSSDGYVLVHRGDVYRIDDGEVVAQDVQRPLETTALAPEGRGKLLLGAEFVADWDLSEAEPLRLYGSHADRVLALDVSRDGRHLASHGLSAVMWELAPEFAASRALVQGQDRGFTSWNVAIAADGSAILASGSTIGLFRRDGSYQPGGLPPATGECFGDWSLSPLGTVVAGNRVDEGLEVLDTRDLSLAASLPANNCAGGVAFSPDGSLLATASLELFETETWSRVWNTPPVTLPTTDLLGSIVEHAVEFSPTGEEVVVTRCQGRIDDSVCSSERYAASDGTSRGAVPELAGDRARYSPEGHWLVSQNRLLHLPSGGVHQYAPEATVATFTPGGDIIAGSVDGSLVRYCRSAE